MDPKIILVIAGCAIAYYRIGETEYNRGFLVAVISVFISVATFFGLGWSIPKMLRLHFLHHRKLLPKLCRCAWDSITMFLHKALDRKDVFPNGILVPQTSACAFGTGM